jgi:toxin HigB-1
MIRSFRHKGLEIFFVSGSKKGILSEHAPKIARILDRLDSSISPNLVDYKDYH